MTQPREVVEALLHAVERRDADALVTEDLLLERRRRPGEVRSSPYHGPAGARAWLADWEAFALTVGRAARER